MWLILRAAKHSKNSPGAFSQLPKKSIARAYRFCLHIIVMDGVYADCTGAVVCPCAERTSELIRGSYKKFKPEFLSMNFLAFIFNLGTYRIGYCILVMMTTDTVSVAVG